MCWPCAALIIRNMLEKWKYQKVIFCSHCDQTGSCDLPYFLFAMLLYSNSFQTTYRAMFNHDSAFPVTITRLMWLSWLKSQVPHWGNYICLVFKMIHSDSPLTPWQQISVCWFMMRITCINPQRHVYWRLVFGPRQRIFTFNMRCKTVMFYNGTVCAV